MLERRSFLRGLFAAPALIKTPGLLMPVKPFALPFSGPITAAEVRMRAGFTMAELQAILNAALESYMKRNLFFERIVR